MNDGTKHGQMKALGSEAFLQMCLDLLRQRALKRCRWMSPDEVKQWHADYAINQCQLELQGEGSRAAQVSKLNLFADFGCLWGQEGVLWVEDLLARKPRIKQNQLHTKMRMKVREGRRLRYFD
jgi:hypothetical protein